MEDEKAPTRFTLCNDQQCCKRFNYLDFATVHTFIDGPDPRDHFANERNTLIWLRTGMILALIGKNANGCGKKGGPHKIMHIH